MKTEYKFAEALKTMMAEVPLDSISVTALTKKCHVNRQTFYYHFTSIYDLLTLVFLSEEVPQIKSVRTINELIESIYKYYSLNKGFVDATLLNSAGKDLFEEFIYNSCYQTILRFVNEIPNAKKLHVNDRKSISRFYASAYSNSIVYYLLTYKNKSLSGLKNCFVFENDNILKEATHKLLTARGVKDD